MDTDTDMADIPEAGRSREGRRRRAAADKHPADRPAAGNRAAAPWRSRKAARWELAARLLSAAWQGEERWRPPEGRPSRAEVAAARPPEARRARRGRARTAPVRAGALRGGGREPGRSCLRRGQGL